jgi:MoxR-like ATPase
VEAHELHDTPPSEAIAGAGDTARRVVENVARVIHAPPELLERCVLGMLCEGHLILEDFPGVGKTMLAKSLARSLDCEFARIQATPDLLPSDITGVNVYNLQANEFEFRPGPVFANLVLVDEINRASPKTQSALLECMQEGQVTIDGATHRLARPFMVIATQNPIEYEGTFPLPEAQLDRFTMRLHLGYPPIAEEARMLAEHSASEPLEELEPVASAADLETAIDAVKRVYVEDSLNRYVVAILRQTRADSRLALGTSPRAGISLLRVSKARALADRRDYVLPDDVQAVATAVLAHRLILGPEARANGTPPQQLVREAVERTPVPA